MHKIHSLNPTALQSHMAFYMTLMFNFVNRVVTGLGVEVEEDSGGYKY